MFGSLHPATCDTVGQVGRNLALHFLLSQQSEKDCAYFGPAYIRAQPAFTTQPSFLKGGFRFGQFMSLVQNVYLGYLLHQCPNY